MQRHRNDTVERLPSPHADKSSPLYVPVELRQAFSEIDDATEEAMKRELWTTVKGEMVRTIGRQQVVIHPKSSDADFNVALTWMKVAEAGRRVARDADRRATEERDRRIHRCKVCHRIDGSALTDSISGDRWCQRCRDEQARQELDEHAALVVNGKSVSELIAAHRKKAVTP